ncbi:hypothetical protein TNCV_2928551 [Trichonephila clavipes]|nr:hypothetical protein TNCV_2928551 [Trichonephila clavipes]
MEEMLDIAQTTPNYLSQEDTQKLVTGYKAMRKELSTVLGEIPLIICPLKDCPTHTEETMNDSTMAESSNKSNDNNSTEQIMLKKKPQKKFQVKTPKIIRIIHKIKNDQDRRTFKLLQNLREKL